MSQSIVVVEDEDSTRRLVEHTLSSSGYDITAFTNGVDAWEHLQNSPPPDLCVLDIMMPGLNGLQLLERIRESKELTAVPVIILTSRGRTDDVVKGIETGATDYVTKPFSPRELVSRVQLRIADS